MNEILIAARRGGKTAKLIEVLLAQCSAQEDRIAELEAAIDKLASGKGRYHTEANYLALIAVRNKSLHK